MDFVLAQLHAREQRDHGFARGGRPSTPELVQQRAEYIQVGGASHAFFDWKPDDTTKATFAKYGVYYAAAMKTFFESVLYTREQPN